MAEQVVSSLDAEINTEDGKDINPMDCAIVITPELKVTLVFPDTKPGHEDDIDPGNGLLATTLAYILTTETEFFMKCMNRVAEAHEDIEAEEAEDK